jgi:hypothetical protein
MIVIEKLINFTSILKLFRILSFILLTLSFYKVEAQEHFNLKQNSIYKDTIYGHITSIDKYDNFFCYGSSEGVLYRGETGLKNKTLFKFNQPIQNLKILNENKIAILLDNFDSIDLVIFNIKKRRITKKVKIENPNFHCEINAIDENQIVLVSEQIKLIYDIKESRITHIFNLPNFTFWKCFKNNNKLIFLAENNDTVYSCPLKTLEIRKSKIKTCNDYKIKYCNDSILFDYCDEIVNYVNFSNDSIEIHPFYNNMPEIAFIDQINPNQFLILFRNYNLIIYDFKQKIIIKWKIRSN